MPGPRSSDNVVDIFSGRKAGTIGANRIIRLAAELDGLEMLYSNDSAPGKIFSMKILCWALRRNGEVEGMIPWLGQLVSAKQLTDPLNGRWEGYYDHRTDHLFYEPPTHKTAELQAASAWFGSAPEEADKHPVQEIPDNIGTHAAFFGHQPDALTLEPVTSWQLMSDGRLQAMVADTDQAQATPVLPGDVCLCPVQHNPHFRYFFHHLIANRLKSGDPETMEHLSQLLQR
ncbi:MAG: hypothetical protein OXC07_10645 [Kistimonas sp.]|nr:hypothetical protein [Kistimonas sp.]